MALHPIKLPKSAAHLFRIVALQKRLLKALADPTLDPNSVDTTWVQNVWSMLDGEWVRRFCLGGQEARIQAIAQATPSARQELYMEFCRQNKVGVLLNAGGNFQDLSILPDFTVELSDTVKKFFNLCYELLGTKGERWRGYEFNGNRSITKRTYQEDFCSHYPTKVVCPYCDGEIGTPELDHYFYKSGFPLLACSPWNLIAVCSSCNDVITAKGDRPAITLGPPRSTNDWLHPFFRPASDEVQIRLNGSPQNSIPQLHSPAAAEQTLLNNHTNLIQSLGKRWTHKIAAYHDVLVSQVNEKIKSNPTKTIGELVQDRLEDHTAARGKTASSLVHAAVCQAILDQRPEYLEEFAAPNAPGLEMT